MAALTTFLPPLPSLTSIVIVISLFLSLVIATSVDTPNDIQQYPIHPKFNPSRAELSSDCNDVDPLPFSTRAYWMRRAVSALYELRDSPCPIQAFGTAIVNHTLSENPDDEELGFGELVCIGVNANQQTGNPTLHGEISAINNCSTVLSKPPYNLSPSEIRSAFNSFSLYTTAEACPMCASAIRWSGFKEYVYSTSIKRLFELNWHQFNIESEEVFRRSEKLGTKTRLVGGVLANETDGLFTWQFAGGNCPEGCSRVDGWCEKDEAEI